MSATSTKSIEGITFAVWSPQEIRKYSVCEITQPETYDEDGMAVQGGLMDGRLGVLEPGQKCLTDGNTAARSPGHFGHIELAEPVLHIAFVDNIYKLLQSTCRTCGRIKMSPEDIAEFSKIKERHSSYTVLSQKRIPDQIQEKAKKQKDCPHCGKSQYELIFTKPTTFVEKTEIGENRLLPITIRERLSIIPDEDLALLGYDPHTARPEWFVLQALPVPPSYC
jgi:DNA-directed RNA polymerase, beta'' subunit/160 kD subunit